LRQWTQEFINIGNPRFLDIYISENGKRKKEENENGMAEGRGDRRAVAT
jgi:hypothetical protein